MRGISEYDSLASIKELYDAASDVDLFYSKECQNVKRIDFMELGALDYNSH